MKGNEREQEVYTTPYPTERPYGKPSVVRVVDEVNLLSAPTRQSRMTGPSG